MQNTRLKPKAKPNLENNLKIFSNSEFGILNVVIIDNICWFIGKEVAEILGYSNHRDAILKHIEKEDKQLFLKSQFTTLENNSFNIPNRGLTCINESGLYSLILSSKLPKAKKFKHWVTSEVLPSIRKTGAYMTPDTLQEALKNPDTMIEILQTLKAEQEKSKALQIKNQNLIKTNKALAKDINTWDDRAVLNALLRAIGHHRFNGNMQYAWNTYYKNLLYKEGINLRSRTSNKKDKLLDCLKPDEWKTAISVAVAMCEESEININKILNKVNVDKISDSDSEFDW